MKNFRTMRVLSAVAVPFILSACFNKDKGGSAVTVQPLDLQGENSGAVVELPSPPTLTSPAVSPFLSNSNSLVLSGECNRSLVVVVGPTSNKTVECRSGKWSHEVTESGPDGTYTFFISQIGSKHERSEPISFSWIRDVQVNPPTVIQPASSPFASGDSALLIRGRCEPGASIMMGGAATNVAACSAEGEFTFTFTPASNGLFEFNFSQIDPAGNISSNTVLKWSQIVGAPSTPSFVTPTATSEYWTNSSALNITGTCMPGLTVTLFGDLSGGGSELATQCGNEGSFAFSPTLDQPGQKTLQVKQTGAWGDSAFATLVVNYDNLPPAPVTALSSPSVSPYISSSTQMLVSGACEDGSTVELVGPVAGDRRTVSCSMQTFSLLSPAQSVDGEYSFSLKQTDRAGNSSDSVLLNWIRSTEVPAAPVITSPAANLQAKLPNLTITGTCRNGYSVVLTEPVTSLNSTIVCENQSFSFVVDQSAATDQTFLFSVLQKNLSGVSSGSSVLTWTLDRGQPVPPQHDLPSGNSFVNSTGFLLVEGPCEAGATVVLYEGSTTSNYVCDSNERYTFSLTRAAGAYAIQLDQTDAAGNRSDKSGTLVWTYDDQVPNPPALTVSEVISNQLTHIVSGTCTPGLDVEIVAGVQSSEVSDPSNSLITACGASSFSFAVTKGSGDANHVLQLAQRNSSGVRSVSTATLTWTIDQTPPETLFTSGPAGVVASDSASFEFDTSGVDVGKVTFECRLDGQPYTACTSPQVYVGLVEGNHELEVRAVDLAGNFDTTPAKRNWAVDSVPDTFIDSGPLALIHVSNAAFTFRSNEDRATFECSLDDATFSACVSPLTVANLVEGAHSFRVRAKDSILQVDATPALHSFTVDFLPETTLSAYPALLHPSVEATFSFSSSAGSETFECSLDESNWAACTSPNTLMGLAQGSHVFRVRAVEGGVSYDPSPESYTFVVDSIAPETSFVAVPDGTLNVNSASIQFSANEAAPVFECSLNGSTFASCASPWSITDLSDGSISIAVRAVDGAGNTDPTPAMHTWNVDTVAPDTQILAGPDSLMVSNTADFTFAGELPGDTFECKLDAEAYSPCTSPNQYTNLSNGSHTLLVRAIDAVGNVDATPASHTWKVENYSTLALLHFDTSPGETVNSVSFTGANLSNVTKSGTVALSTSAKKFGTRGESISMTTSASTTGRTMISNTAVDALATSKFTVEGWFRVTALATTTGQYQVLASKQGTADFSWQLRLYRASDGRNYLSFVVGTGTNGGTRTEAMTVNSTQAISATVMYHVAAVFDQGAMRLYRNGVLVASASAPSASIFASTGAIRLGTDGLASPRSASLYVDEFRYSRVPRYSSAFSAPAAAFTAD